MAIEMKSLSPNLMVNDINKTLQFYTEVLGFTQIAAVPESGRFVWGMVKSGTIIFMFQQTDSIKEEYPSLQNFERGGGLSFYISVSNLQQLF